MAETDEFDAMADACIEAGERVMQSGSAELQAAMRAALYVLGREIARRRHAAASRETNGTHGAN